MKAVSTLYKTLRTDPNAWYEIQILQGNKIYNLGEIVSASLHVALIHDSGFTVGCTQAAECRITIKEMSENWARMAQFTLRFRINNSDGTQHSEWVTVGTYYTDERSEDKHGNLSIIGYDGMLFTEQFWTDSVPSGQLPTSYPITSRAFAQMVQSAGLCTFSDLSSLDDSVAFIGLDTSSTIRDKLKDIAAAHGGNWQIASDGSLELVFFRNIEQSLAIAGIAVADIAIVGRSSADEITDDNVLNLGLSMQGLEISPPVDQVSGVTLETVNGTKSIAGTATRYMLKAGCEFSASDGVAGLCFSHIQGFSYKPFKIRTADIDPIADVGDIIVADGEGYQIMELDWTFNKHPTANISAPFEAEVDHEFTIVSKEAKTYRKSLAATDEKLEDYSTTVEMQTAINQTADAIKMEASATYVKNTEFNDYKRAVDSEFSVQSDAINARVRQEEFENYQDDVEDEFSELVSAVESELSVQADAIAAKVSKTGGENTSFGWVMNDSSHTWYANNQEVMAITQSGLSIQGEIRATSGYIGDPTNGFSITATGISHGMTSFNDTQHNGVYIGADGIALGGGKFKVDAQGNIYAASGTFTGDVYAKNIITGTTASGIDAGYITGSQIGEGEVGTINIGEDAVTGFNIDDRTIAAENIGTHEITDLEVEINGLTTDSTSVGINASLANADLFGAATAEGTSTYPQNFTAARVNAYTAFYSGAYKVQEQGEVSYDLTAHYHSFTERDGKVYMGAPTGDSSKANFNIADTQAYKDGVAAVTVQSFNYEVEEGVTNYRAAWVHLTSGTNYAGIDTGDAVDYGIDTGAQTAYVSAITAGQVGTPSWSDEDQVYYANVVITATARGTKADGSYYTSSRDLTRAIDVTSVYTAGKTAGQNIGAETAYVSAIATGRAGIPSYSSEDDVYYANVSITGTARGTKADGSYYTSDRTLTRAVDVTNVYTVGKQLGINEGAQTAYVSSVTTGAAGEPSYSSEDGVYYANVAITATARGTKSDGSYYTADRTITRSVDVTTVYNAGKTSGATSLTVANPTVNGAAGTPSYSDEDSKYYSNVSITATATTTKGDGTTNTGTNTKTVAIDVTAVYQAGQASGGGNVTVDTVALNPSVTYGGNKKYVVPIKATASNGAYKEVLISFDATEAYNEGANTLVADAPTVATHSNTHTVIGSNHYVTASINSKAHTTAFDGTTISATTAGSLAILANQVYEDGYTAGQNAGGGSVQTITSVAATASNYGTYDKAIAPSFASLYTSGAYSYGLANIALSNGDETLLRFRVPAVNDITVARPYGDMQDWDLSESNHVYVNVNLSALSNSTVLATDTGRVNVDDIVNFFATNTGAVIATDSSNYNTYDDGLTFYVQNFLYTDGNYQYARIQLRNSDGNDLSLIRIQLDKAGSSSGQITITNEATSQSVNPYYGTLPYYAFVNNKHYVYIKAVSTGVSNRTQYIDINDIVNYAYALGQQSGSGSSVTVRSVKATSNKTYDSNMDMYYVMVRVTYSDGSWQNFQAWYD